MPHHCSYYMAVPARRHDGAHVETFRSLTVGSDNGDPRMRAVLSYIDSHIGDFDLDADRLQSVFHISRPTLYRMFRKEGGVARFIRQRRLVAAHYYLRSRPDVSITWLLYELGFTSERQFQRAFQARFGLSPSEWRACCKASIME